MRRHIPILALLGLLSLTPAAAVAKSRKPSFKPYPGAQLVKSMSDQYREEQDAEKAYVYKVKAGFKKVVRFYKDQLSDGALAETESENLYMVVTQKIDLRVEPGKGGWIWIKAAMKRVSRDSSGGGHGSGQQGRQGDQGQGDQNQGSQEHNQGEFHPNSSMTPDQYRGGGPSQGESQDQSAGAAIAPRVPTAPDQGGTNIGTSFPPPNQPHPPGQ